jgi:hypothetical protein
MHYYVNYRTTEPYLMLHLVIFHVFSLWCSQREAAGQPVLYSFPIFSFLLLETTTILVTVLWPDVALPSAKCHKLIHHLFTVIMHSSIVSIDCILWCTYWCIQLNLENDFSYDAFDCCCHLLDRYSLNRVCSCFLVTRCYYVAVVPFISEQPLCKYVHTFSQGIFSKIPSVTQFWESFPGFLSWKCFICMKYRYTVEWFTIMTIIVTRLEPPATQADTVNTLLYIQV